MKWILSAVIILAAALFALGTGIFDSNRGNVAADDQRQEKGAQPDHLANPAGPTERELIEALAANFNIEPSEDRLHQYLLAQQPQLRSDKSFEQAAQPTRDLLAALEKVQSGADPAAALSEMNEIRETPMSESVWAVHRQQLQDNPEYLDQLRSQVSISREAMVQALLESEQLPGMYLEDALLKSICGLPEVNDRINATLRNKGIPDNLIDRGVVAHECLIESRQWYLAHARNRGFKGGRFEDSDLTLFASADILRKALQSD